MKRILSVAGFVLVLAIAGLAVYADSQRQKADNSWKPAVAQPAFTDRHPRVLIDEAHFNAHTAGGKYAPFARLLTADGCEVIRNQGAFTAATLAGADVLVIANAAGGPKPQLLGINLPSVDKRTRDMPALSPEEITAVRTWVEAGGALLLIADHAPFGASVSALAEAFGVTMHGGFVEVEGMDSAQDDPSMLVFTRAAGLLGDHPITQGSIERVVTFTGQSLDGPEATALLRLPESAKEYIPGGGDQMEEHRAGAAQGLALERGSGRVVVLGEAGMLTAQMSGGVRFGMNVPGNDNQQFALNIIHWLVRRM